MSVARAHSAVRSVGWRAIAAGPAVAAVTVIVALVATGDVDVPLRDPDNVAATYFVLVGLGVALLVWLNVAIRAARAYSAAERSSSSARPSCPDALKLTMSRRCDSGRISSRNFRQRSFAPGASS